MPLTDENLETTVPGIYAAGDVSGIEEASSAMVEGRLAGYAAAESLGHHAETAERLKKEAAAELVVLRSGPAGEKIRAGLKLSLIHILISLRECKTQSWLVSRRISESWIFA